MRTIRPDTALTVRTADGRYRHAVVTAVNSQDDLDVRIGLVGNSASANVTRRSSTTTRGEEFAQ